MGLQSTELEYATVSHREHLQIFESLQKRDADEARRRMEEHIYRSMRDILTRYQ
ncbi:MAG: FCD domain-containing protein [Clostridium sp.]